ncbi:MAG: prenyltransferase [Chloroflexota bacterium]
MRSRIWRGFWQLADPKIWVASTVPMLVGAALAYGDTGRFSLYWMLVSLLGVYCIEIAKNATNEFADFTAGIDQSIAPDKRTPFSGGKKTIVDGLLTVAETKIIATATLSAGILIGLYITFAHEPAVLWVGLIGVFFATFYSLPPFRFNYTGIGEFVVGATFGPIMVSGIYLVMTHTLNVQAVLTGVPIGFLIANVLWINQYPDYEADALGGKRNWVVRLGRKAALRVYYWLFVLAFVALAALSLVYRNPLWLLGLVAVPLERQAVAIARRHYDDIPALIPANAKTVIIYQLVGLMMVIAALTNSLI